MPLIRQSLADPSVRDAVVLHLGDLHRAGEHLRDQSRREAETILAAARAERDRIVSGAEKDGQARGLEKGLAEGRQRGAEEARTRSLAEWRERLAGLEKGWGDALDRFLAERERMLLEARQDVLRLAILLAERLTKRALTVDPSLVGDQVAEVLSLVARPSRLVLSLHPEDRPIIEEILPGLRRRFASVEHLELVDDPSLPRGSCIARTAGGVIDASISTQLDRIAEALLPGGAGRPAELPIAPAPADTPTTPAPESSS